MSEIRALNLLIRPYFIIRMFSVFLTLTILRMSFPHIRYPFLLFGIPFMFLFLAFFMKEIKTKRFNVKLFIESYGLLLLSFVILIVAFVMNPMILGTVISDLLNGSLLILSSLMFFVLVNKKIYLKFLLLNIVRLVFISGVLLASIGLIKYVAFMYGFTFSWIDSTPYPKGTSLVSDYNYFSYYLLLSFLSSIFLIFRKRAIKKSQKWFYLLSLLTIQMAILGSASRRGFIVMILLNVILVLLIYKTQHRKAVNYRYIIKCTISVWVCCILVFFSLSIIPASTKVSIVDHMQMNLKKVSESTCKINYRYNTILKGSHNYKAYHKETWGFYPGPDSTLSEAPSRIIKFKFALKLFRDAPLKAKLIGNGFSYLENFGEEFSIPSKKLITDYPHNLFLSALLYSGVLGTLIIGLLFLQVCWIIFKLKELKLFMIIVFALSLIFNFFSGNSLFSISIFGFSLLLPLHAYYLQNKKISIT